ncbi:MAG: cob(I)yrinic acid a,c-diamide adenosyltransferase [Eubacteriaceae bacterium]|jgi:ATP:cob(I)alamin adenosyltransferase
MPNVYTRTGDKGTTGLFGGARTPKNDIRVEAYGTMDEANAAIGFAKSIIEDVEIQEILNKIQKRIFVLGAELASDAKGKEMLKDKISQADVDYLEQMLDKYLAIVGKQKDFVIPGANPTSASLHQARTIVRRGERRIIDYADQDTVRPELIKFANRLSDLLFVLARTEEYNDTVRQVTNKVEEMLKKRGIEIESNNQKPAECVAVKCSSDKMIDDPEMNILTLAKRMAQASRIKAAEMNIPIVFSAVDKHGNLVYLEREEDSLLASIDIARKKAYTAAALKTPTDKLAELSKEDGPLFGLPFTSDGEYVIFGGGYPIVMNGQIIGAIGVSGGTADEDMQIASAGLTVLDRL